MKIVLAVLILILIGLQVRLWSGPGSYADISRLDGRIEAQTVDNDNLEQRNNVLHAEVDELKTGMDAVEERARNELGMIKKGETFYLIVDE